jgi:hypothetical protein
MLSASTSRGLAGTSTLLARLLVTGTTVGDVGEAGENESIGLRVVLGDRIRYAAQRLW